LTDRDWFPISFISTLCRLCRHGKGNESQWGSLSLRLPPNCGVGTALMINKETKEWAPVPRFLDATQLTADVTAITDAARGKTFSQLHDGHGPPEELSPVPGTQGPQALRSFQKVRQDLGAHQEVHHQVRPHFTERTYEDA